MHPAAHACKLLRGGRGKAPSWAPLQSTMAQDYGAWSGPCAVLLCLCHWCRGGCVCPQCHPDPGWAALAAAAAWHLWHTHMHTCQGRGQKPPCAGEPPCVPLHCGREPEQLTQQVPARGTACVSWRGREHAAGRAAPSTDVELPTRAKLGKGPRGGTVTSAGAGLKGDSACLPARGKCNG